MSSVELVFELAIGSTVPLGLLIGWPSKTTDGQASANVMRFTTHYCAASC